MKIFEHSADVLLLAATSGNGLVFLLVSSFKSILLFKPFIIVEGGGGGGDTDVDDVKMMAVMMMRVTMKIRITPMQKKKTSLLDDNIEAKRKRVCFHKRLRQKSP